MCKPWIYERSMEHQANVSRRKARVLTSVVIPPFGRQGHCGQAPPNPVHLSTSLLVLGQFCSFLQSTHCITML